MSLHLHRSPGHWTPSSTRPPHSRSSSRKSSVLSLSSLVDDGTASTLALDDDLLLRSPLKHPQEVVRDACGDVSRELEAVEARLGLYRRARQHEEKQENRRAQPLRGADHVVLSSGEEDSAVTQLQRSQRQEAGQVADEVESALFNCEQLLRRARASAAGSNTSFSSRSAASSRASTSKPNSLLSRPTVRESLPNEPIEPDMQQHAPAASFVPVKSAASPPSSPSSSPSSSPPTAMQRGNHANAFDAVSADERELETRATAIKAFATRCQQEMQTEAAVAQQQQLLLQTGFLKELQRKYESKKKMSVLALKEGYERETKALVRDTMDKYEQEQAQLLAKLEEELLRDRERAMNEIVAKQEQALEDRTKRLEARVSAETLAKKRQLESQLQAELDEKLRAIESDSEDAMHSWEVQKRLDLEHELFQRREQATMSILRDQETKTSDLKREIEQQHAANEQSELEKLKKALAFGAQAQLQQLRKKLDSEHEDRTRDTKAGAAQSLEIKLQDLKQVLQRAHQDELSKLRRELEKKHRIAAIELQESLQTAHHAQVQAIRAKADSERESALAVCKDEAAREHRRQLDELEQTLEMDLRVRLHQTEMELEERYAQSLDGLRVALIESHERELQARVERMEQARAILLSEARSYLSTDTRRSGVLSQSEASPEASRHLSDLKRHLSGEIAKHVETLLADFDDMAEEQRILVVKISELTQLYLSFKRQCEKLETQSGELKSALHTLHTQLQTKDMMCAKLYQANEALLKKLQVPQTPPAKRVSRQ